MRWTRETVRGTLVELLAKHADTKTPISDTTNLVGDLGIDSLGVMEIVASLEDTFRLQIPDEALRGVETVADVANVIEARLSGEGRLGG